MERAERLEARRGDWTDGEPRLLVATCERCGQQRYLPRLRCPVCGGEEATDAPASGRGLCVAATRLHAAATTDGEEVRLVLVELDEGPVVMGRAHDDTLAPGDRALLSFRDDGRDGALVPSFTAERP
jgi:uncharacterized protein